MKNDPGRTQGLILELLRSVRSQTSTGGYQRAPMKLPQILFSESSTNVEQLIANSPVHILVEVNLEVVVHMQVIHLV